MRTITVNAQSELYAIFGTPIRHAMSPVIMNTFFDRLGMDKVFLALDANLETFDQLMEAARIMPLQGYVFTMPVKEKAVRFMDALSDEAGIIGAVNCAKHENGRLIGYNTDSIGFWNAVQARNPGGRKIARAFVLGAGGFARSAVAQLALQGVDDIVVTNRLSEEHFVRSFREFAARLEDKVPSSRVRLVDWSAALWEKELPGCGVIANGTPNGMNGVGDLHEIFPFHQADRDAIVFDAIYEPRFTRFLRKAESLGFVTVEGLDLLVHQGASSFFNWTGVTVNPEEMKEAVIQFMNTRRQ